MNLPSLVLLPISPAFWPGLAAVDPYAMSPGRLGAIVAGLLGLAGLAIGWKALHRQKTGAGTGRRGAVAALVAGPLGAILGGIVAFTAAGGIGTGNGRGGGYVAMVVGTIATILGARALARSRTLMNRR